jgi:hypothetical protein
MKRSQIFAGAATALALLSSTLRAVAAPSPDVNTVVSELTARMDAVSAYKARIHLAVRLHSFPFLAADLEGSTSYVRPGRYSVTFDSLPSLASAFQKVSGDVGDPAAWKSKYDIAVEPPQPTATPNTLALRLTEKVKGQIDHAMAFVDLTSHTVTRMEWYYNNGGRIAMEQHFAPVDGVLLVDSQAADIDMPGYKATAQAVFDGYSVQVSMTPATHTSVR